MGKGYLMVKRVTPGGWPRSRLLLPLADIVRAGGKPVRIGFSLAKDGHLRRSRAFAAQRLSPLAGEDQRASGLEMRARARPVEFIQYDDRAIRRSGERSTRSSSVRTRSTSCSRLGARPRISRSRRWSSAQVPRHRNTAASVSLRDLKPGTSVHDGRRSPTVSQGARALAGERRQVGGFLTNVLPFSKE